MVRFASPRLAVALLVCLGGSAAAAGAEDLSAPSLREIAAAAVVPAAPPDHLNVALAGPTQQRPRALVPLYFSFGILQVLDTHSTSRALGHGAVEANPLMKDVVGNTAAFVAVKAAGTAGLIHVSERIWRKNRTAAAILMLATNSAMVGVVQHNYRAAR